MASMATLVTSHNQMVEFLIKSLIKSLLDTIYNR